MRDDDKVYYRVVSRILYHVLHVLRFSPSIESNQPHIGTSRDSARTLQQLFELFPDAMKPLSLCTQADQARTTTTRTRICGTNVANGVRNIKRPHSSRVSSSCPFAEPRMKTERESRAKAVPCLPRPENPGAPPKPTPRMFV